MKIVIDLTSLADNFTGFERFALNLADELICQYCQSHFVLVFKETVHQHFIEYLQQKNIDYVVLKRSNKLWFNQVVLLRAMNRIDADLYLFPAFPAPFFFNREGIVNTIHDLGCWDCANTMPQKMVLYFRVMYRRASKQSKKILTVSQFSKRRIENVLQVPSNKIIVVYNGVSSNIYEQSNVTWDYVKDKYNLPDKYIMCLSTLEPRKNLKLLLKAYTQLVLEEKCSYKLVLAGRKGWKLNEVVGEVSEEIESMICFTGYVDDEDLSCLYRHAQVFVFPSIYEGFGIPPLEAMANGCLVVSSDAEAMVEVLKDYAIYFRNDDEQDLKRVLVDLLDNLSNQDENNAMIEYAREYQYSKSFAGLIEKISGER